MSLRRWVIALVAVWFLLGAAPAGADAPGPTDYVSRVVKVEPATDAFDMTIVGGDSFVVLTVRPGHVVTVAGYQREPYLRFDADSSVWENQRSPSKYLNEERYGTDTGPEDADAGSEPLWKKVANDGTFAWHDHRAHWMNDQPPLGSAPGDQILEEVIPLELNGQLFKVTVTSVLQSAPSPVALLWGLGLGIVGAVAMVKRGIDHTVTFGIGSAASLAVLVSSIVSYQSVPSVTGPSVVPILLGAAASTAIVAAANSRVSSQPLLRSGLMMFAGVELAVFAWIDHPSWRAAIVPTDLPATVHRSISVVAACVGVALVGVAIARLRSLLAPR